MLPDADPRGVRAVAFVGPTAAGKARLGREAARRFGVPVLVCDSVKVYRGLDIGSAKPSPATRAAVRHELLDLVDPDAVFSAVDYAREAWTHLRRDGRGLLVGGTGFYLRAVGWTRTDHVDDRDRPPDDPARFAFETRWRAEEAQQAGAIHRALSAVDPSTARSIHPNNLVRLLRALWLCEISGTPVSAMRAADPPRPRLHLMMVVVDPEPDALDHRIAARLERMLEAGWLREVEKLMEAGYDSRCKAMRSLGYRQLLEVVEGRCPLSEARAAIYTATRQYARRQRAYLRTQLPAERTVWVREPSACPWDEIAGHLDVS